MIPQKNQTSSQDSVQRRHVSSNLLFLLIILGGNKSFWVVTFHTSSQSRRRARPSGKQFRPLAFAPSTTDRTLASWRRSPVRCKALLFPAAAAAEAADEKQKRSEDDNSEDWTEVPGGFVPHFQTSLPATTSAPAPMILVTTLEEYKRVVVDAPRDTLTVVRFAAPWCRACQAVQPHFSKLKLHYSQQAQQQQQLTTASTADCSAIGNTNPFPIPMKVQFVECPVRKDTALLHQGLGVPSVPFGHVYHPTAGLVEEVKINRKVFGKFAALLQTHVQGYCVLPQEQEGEGNRNPSNNEHVEMNVDDETSRFPMSSPLSP